MFKIDLQKAYATVEWDFVENLLNMLQFPTGREACDKEILYLFSFFTLYMEYLTRTLKYAAAKFDFGFHPMFFFLVKWFSSYVQTNESHKSNVSAAKSNAYFCGVSDQLKLEILRVSGFSEGELPFRYLGMPIQTTRLKKKDYECFVEKICNRFHSYGARKFSYAGKLTLVQAVLNSLCSY
ncbi:uncharacterized protein LOC141588065 [Silene latifolia]|uniref:uncharacterized protein LOC141588065 n=1 Tax=Silene latifolia TaxID=37657 RepID=UPI003D78002B